MRGLAAMMIVLAALLLPAAGPARAGGPAAAGAHEAADQALDPADRARLAEVAEATDRAHDELQRIALVELQRPEVAARWRARVAGLRAAFAGISRPGHPMVLAVAHKIAAIEAYVESGIERARAMTGSLEGGGSDLGAAA